jgi:hypothetical protein
MCYSPVSYWSGSEEEEGRTELGYEEKDDIEEDKVKHVCSSLCWSLRPPDVLINTHPNMFDIWPMAQIHYKASSPKRKETSHTTPTGSTVFILTYASGLVDMPVMTFPLPYVKA